MSESDPRHTEIPAHVDRLAMIARWKPVHLGHAAILDALVERSNLAIVGIGSSNRYDVSNPFTAEETAEMIRLVLGDRDDFRLVEVPDLGHGPRWRAMVTEIFGPLDLFVTANAYVRSLLEDDYTVVHPGALVVPERHVAVDGSLVRLRMARGEPWEELVPHSIAEYLTGRGLVDRFRREFGLQTLALDAPRGL